MPQSQRSGKTYSALTWQKLQQKEMLIIQSLYSSACGMI